VKTRIGAGPVLQHSDYLSSTVEVTADLSPSLLTEMSYCLPSRNLLGITHLICIPYFFTECTIYSEMYGIQLIIDDLQCLTKRYRLTVLWSFQIVHPVVLTCVIDKGSSVGVAAASSTADSA